MKSQKKTDQRTKQPVLKADGTQREAWAFGVAYDKAQFDQYIRPYLDYEARMVFPNGTPRDFAWKFKDGDTDVDKNNKPLRDKEGYAGCYVLAYSTEAFCPSVYKNEGGRYRQLEAHEIKTGDYVVVSANTEFNKSQQSPGLYVNPKMVELVGYGQEIINASDNPDEAFGGRTYQLPPGASATPQAPQGGALPPNAAAAPAPQQGYGQPPMAQQPPAYAQPPAAPQQGYGQPPMAQQPPAAPQAGYPVPAHDLVNNLAQPPAAPQQGYGQPPMAQQPPAAPQAYAPAGNGQPNVHHAPPQQPPATPSGGYGAAPATTYPSNVPPGVPQR